MSHSITPRQHRLIRMHLALIPVYAWLLFAWATYAVDISTTGRLDRSGHNKGHDFAHFYVLGEIARDRATDDLYSFEAQARRLDRVLPQFELRFLPVHSPQVAVFFAPLAGIAYERAVAIWLFISAGIYAGCCYALWAALPNLRTRGWLVALLAVAFPAFYSLIAAGQTSAFALLWITLGFIALKHKRPWLAGLALGSLIYKPTLVLVLPLAFIYARDYRVLAGASTAAVLQVAGTWLYFGHAAISGYVHNFRTVAEHLPRLEARPELMHSLKSFFSILLPWPIVANTLYVASALVVATIAVRAWRTAAPLTLRYAVVLLATVLVNPHVYNYELVVLVPALLCIGSWAIEQRATAVRFIPWLYLCFALPAFDGVTSVTRIQWSVPALAVLTVMVARAARPSPSADHARVVS